MEDRRPAVLIVSIIVFVLASLVVGLLFISKIFVVKKVASYDYLMLFAWVRTTSPLPSPCEYYGSDSFFLYDY